MANNRSFRLYFSIKAMSAYYGLILLGVKLNFWYHNGRPASTAIATKLIPQLRLLV
ncbi:hypothetical protein PMIN01_13510 [Paraphaeosphaeria minitans]|uniref:Uncharacterized protein n=1 Tax=Paraphaeosphaeria minitans TaxID=565426 RepID=A0A9P6G4H2_9PLEO|nr:hypothetical protein PMIN01_13676 [Paraphaeosphaeria minitans]KAF9728682.1 hypothetical protein PMIN01_13510 [Paraphaeosphaeria minitans]